MRRTMWGRIAAAVALGMLAMAPVQAEEKRHQDQARDQRESALAMAPVQTEEKRPSDGPPGSFEVSDGEDSGCLGDCSCDEDCGCGWVAPCPDCCRGVFGGMEVTFLQPYFHGNEAFVTTRMTQNEGNNSSNIVNASDQFTYQFGAGPRIWLGYMGPGCFGGRVRWWSFDHTSNTEGFTAGPGFNAATPGTRVHP